MNGLELAGLGDAVEEPAHPRRRIAAPTIAMFMAPITSSADEQFPGTACGMTV
jgi:hypothetical protein